jgi:hypothetical protein
MTGVSPRTVALIGVALSLQIGHTAILCAQTTPSYKYFRAGHPTDIATQPEPGFALIGGGKDLDLAFQWLGNRARRGDFLVLRASGTDAYNPYILKLATLNSVATLIIPSREAAADPFVAQTISRAEAIFIAGGDQANYINFWKGTPVQVAMNEALRRGVPIGGRANISTPRSMTRPTAPTSPPMQLSATPSIRRSSSNMASSTTHCSPEPSPILTSPPGTAWDVCSSSWPASWNQLPST